MSLQHDELAHGAGAVTAASKPQPAPLVPGLVAGIEHLLRLLKEQLTEAEFVATKARLLS